MFQHEARRKERKSFLQKTVFTFPCGVSNDAHHHSIEHNIIWMKNESIQTFAIVAIQNDRMREQNRREEDPSVCVSSLWRIETRPRAILSDESDFISYKFPWATR